MQPSKIMQRPNEQKDEKKRPISYSYYLISINIVIILLLVGAIAYFIIDNKRMQYKQDEYFNLETNYLSLQLQYTLLNQVLNEPNPSCTVLNTALEDSVSDLGYSLDKLMQYEKESLNDIHYQSLKRRYTLDNIKYFLFVKKANELCNVNKISILYFYTENCTICPDQGVVLSYYKTKYKETILVFPFNTDDAKKEPSVKMLISMYNITQYPTIIIDTTKYTGVVYKEELGNILANEFDKFNKTSNTINNEKSNYTK